MQKITLINDYRKCLKCGKTTDNMKKDFCTCGGYMYMMGACYVPNVKEVTRCRC